jgi:tetrahydromethanopterin S-methyltransferase subunit G
VQTTQPRDIGILALVIGLFLILFVVTVMVGPPATFG